MGSDEFPSSELVYRARFRFQVVHCKRPVSEREGGKGKEHRSDRSVPTKEFIKLAFLSHETDPHAFVPLSCGKTSCFSDLPHIRLG